MKTIAEQLGQTPHLSPLLRKLRLLGFSAPDRLRQLAVLRGCMHYRLAEEPADLRDPGKGCVSNAELAIAMVSAAQVFDAALIRCAAQLLGGDDIEQTVLTRLAIQERALPVVRHIAHAAVEMDTEKACWWKALLEKLPTTPEVPEGRLPHRSRFVSQTGLQRVGGRLSRATRSVWLRPVVGKNP